MSLTPLVLCHDIDVPTQLSVVCIYTPEVVQLLRDLGWHEEGKMSIQECLRCYEHGVLLYICADTKSYKGVHQTVKYQLPLVPCDRITEYLIIANTSAEAAALFASEFNLYHEYR